MHMKTLVISDTHLDLPFDEKKYALLERIISDADRVIINGDFWEGFPLTFDKFYSSSWNKLFPLLKSKKTIYIFRNHDAREYTDTSKLRTFSEIQTDRYTFKENGDTYVFEHRHTILPFEKQKPDVRNPEFQKTVRKVDNFEKLIVRHSGSLYQLFVSIFNTILRNRVRRELTGNEFFFADIHISTRSITKNDFIIPE